MRRVLTAIAAARQCLSRPPRQPLKSCPHCGTQNEPNNTTCISCLRRM